MEANKEISALFNLIDDPDEEVFDVVSEKIVGFGRPIIPNLEDLWESTPNEEIQSRIENIIHRLHYYDLIKEFRDWKVNGDDDLLQAALLVGKFQYPEMAFQPILQEVEKMKRNIWLELNSFLTPLEEISILSSILYNYFAIKGIETNHKNPNDFLLNKAVESKKGNQFSNGILYLILCELLDIPIRTLNIPNQFVLGYYKKIDFDENEINPKSSIEFLIDPLTGLVFTHRDLQNYFTRINKEPDPSFYFPRNNTQVIQQSLNELSKCFKEGKEQYKQNELQELINLLKDE